MRSDLPTDPDDPDYIEFLDDQLELIIIKEIFMTAPLVYSHGFVVGKDTNYIIEMIKAYEYDVKTTLPIITSMSNIYTNTILKNNK